MKLSLAIQILREMDKKGLFVFSKHELAKLFPEDNEKTFSEALNRLVKANILRRACRGIYVNENGKSFNSDTIEHVAMALRSGEYNYISLESILSGCGVISQILIDHLTVMTTGRKGTYHTPYGTIEFTHTKRPVQNILQSTTRTDNHRLRVATKETAWRDLKRVGRNVNMVNKHELEYD